MYLFIYFNLPNIYFDKGLVVRIYKGVLQISSNTISQLK